MTRVILQGIEEVSNMKRHICCKNYMRFRKWFRKGMVLLWLECPNHLGYLFFLSNPLNILNVLFFHVVVDTVEF